MLVENREILLGERRMSLDVYKDGEVVETIELSGARRFTRARHQRMLE